LNDGILKRFLDEGKNMSPSDRGEMLTKAVDMINTHKEIAVEGQTAVNILCTILKLKIFCVCVCVLTNTLKY